MHLPRKGKVPAEKGEILRGFFLGLCRVPLGVGDLVRATLELMGICILWSGSDWSIMMKCILLGVNLMGL